MNIIILGCGQVGSNVAYELASIANNAVTIIDNNESALKNLSNRLDVQTIVGNGASPSVLEQAGAQDADMLLALTRSDEVNLIACKIAADFFNIPSRIARVRFADYLEFPNPNKETAQTGTLATFSVTDSINPEQLVTEHLIGLFSHSSALQVISFGNEHGRMLVVQVAQGAQMIKKAIEDLAHLLPDSVDCQICAMYRNNRLIMPNATTRIYEGDEICLVTSTKHAKLVMRLFRPHEQSNQRIMVAGGGNVGYKLAKQIENDYDIKIIEYSEQRAEWLAENLNSTLVLNGSATDEGLLTQEYIDEIDVFCAITNDDENNIMSSLLAKNLGARRVVTLINRSRYVDLLEGNQIDIIVSPHLITIGNILAHIRRGDIVSVHPLRRGKAEAIEVVVHGDKNTSALIGRTISEIRLPAGCHLAALVREEKVLMGHHSETVLQDNDHLLFFVARRHASRELEKLIQVKMGFFG